MTKHEMFDSLWISEEWYLMGYDKDSLMHSMTKQQVEFLYKKHKEEKDASM